MTNVPNYPISGNIYDHCSRFLGKGNKVELLIDFGARHGESFEQIGKHCSKDFVFIEPLPACATIIRTMMVKHFEKPPLLHIIEGILGDKKGITELITFANDDHQSSNVFTDRGGKHGITLRVPIDIIPYSTLFPGRKIDFAKINIEGGEYDMVESPFFDQIDSFVMEVHNQHIPGKTYIDIINALKDKYELETFGPLDQTCCLISGKKCISPSA